MRVQIELPYPPSLNHIWRIAGKRNIKSNEYNQWLTNAGWVLRTQRPKVVSGRIRISILLCAPDNRRRDLDNCIKVILDLLVKQNMIEGDDKRYIRAISAEWVDDGSPCVVIIETAS